MFFVQRKGASLGLTSIPSLLSAESVLWSVVGGFERSVTTLPDTGLESRERGWNGIRMVGDTESSCVIQCLKRGALLAKKDVR